MDENKIKKRDEKNESREFKNRAYELEAVYGNKVILNTGKINSSQMSAILDVDVRSRQRVYRKVRLWDEEDVALYFQLEIDGKSVRLSDESWLASQNGPIRENDMQQGEFVDARLELGYGSIFRYARTRHI